MDEAPGGGDPGAQASEGAGIAVLAFGPRLWWRTPTTPSSSFTSGFLRSSPPGFAPSCAKGKKQSRSRRSGAFSASCRCGSRIVNCYAQCYYRVRGEVVLFGLFNAVHILHRRSAGLLCESTGKRKYYSSLLVGLEGSVVLSVDNKEGEVLQQLAGVRPRHGCGDICVGRLGATSTATTNCTTTSECPLRRTPPKPTAPVLSQLSPRGSAATAATALAAASTTAPAVATSWPLAESAATTGSVSDGCL